MKNNSLPSSPRLKETRYPFDPEGGMSWGLRKKAGS